MTDPQDTPDSHGNRADACGWCDLLPTVNGWVRATQDRCPVHGTNPDPPASPASPREVFLPQQAISAIEAAARECYRRWESTPNRDAYVWVEMERATRAAVHAVAADLLDGAARRERARTVDYLREHVGHMSARDIERGDHWTDLPGRRGRDVDECQERAAHIAEGDDRG